MDKYIVINGIKVARDFTPETFGRLTTIGPRFILRSHTGKTQAYQVCQCECGAVGVYAASQLRYKRIRSCGCLQRESRYTHRRVHGECRKTPEYGSWKRMKGRCLDPNNNRYSLYGARGIAICKEWQGINGYVNFLADMGRKPSPKHSLDRIDVNGDYCPENCRWATPTEQARNTRNNRMLTAFGKTQCISAWAEETGILGTTIQARVQKGWSTEDALTVIPPQNKTLPKKK